MYTYISMSVSMDMYMYTSMQSPLEFPLGNGDPGPHDSLEIWVCGFSTFELWTLAFFRGVPVAIWLEAGGSIL